MKMRLYASIAVATFMALSIAATAGAQVPPPPVNQNLGLPDSVFNNLAEADCRICHQDPNVTGATSNVDRHHLKLGTTISDPTASPNGTPGGNYECLSCHDMAYNETTMSYDLVQNFRDCLNCHEQVAGQASVHHLSAKAQAADCKACHGSFVDNMDDGHAIPTYGPSLVTPYPSRKPNAGTNGEGNCTFCHATGTPDGAPAVDAESGVLVYTNQSTHHSTGFGADNSKCIWCHDTQSATPIRSCEKCHGISSLHNIQFDNAGDGIQPGQEAPFYGHIGAQADCNGCHGFSAASASAPSSGPVVPALTSLSAYSVPAGADTPLTMEGSSFVNSIQNPMTGTFDITLNSEVVLTDAFGTEYKLAPVNVSPAKIEVVVPSYLAAGSYKVAAVKGPKASNPLTLNVVPKVEILAARAVDGKVTITGSGFGRYLEAGDSGTTVIGTVTVARGKNRGTRSVEGKVASWTDSEIVVEFPGTVSKVQVASVFGKAATDVTDLSTPTPSKRGRRR